MGWATPPPAPQQSAQRREVALWSRPIAPPLIPLHRSILATNCSLPSSQGDSGFAPYAVMRHLARAGDNAEGSVEGFGSPSVHRGSTRRFRVLRRCPAMDTSRTREAQIAQRDHVTVAP
jgi:hypothetical protein